MCDKVAFAAPIRMRWCFIARSEFFEEFGNEL
jgi:hypothetical protein